MPFFPSLLEDATTKHIFAAHPEIYSHWARVSEAILRGPSPLTPAQRELIGAYVSSLNSCHIATAATVRPRNDSVFRRKRSTV